MVLYKNKVHPSVYMDNQAYEDQESDPEEVQGQNDSGSENLELKRSERATETDIELYQVESGNTAQNSVQPKGHTINGHSNGHTQNDETKYSRNDDHHTQEHTEPWRFCRWLVEYPRTVFFVTLGLHLLMLLVLGILLAAKYPILPLVFDSLPLELRETEDYLRSIAWSQRDENNVIMEREFTSSVQDQRSQFRENIEMYFEDKNGKNVITKKNLKKMKEIEDILFNLKDFQDNICMLRFGSCIAPTSILRFFDGTFAFLDSAFSDPDYDDVENVMYLANYYNETKGLLVYMLAKNAKISQNSVKSHIVRGYMSVGFPLKGYKDVDDDVDKQNQELDEFYTDSFMEKANKYYEDGAGDMNFYYSSGTLIGLFILQSVIRDIVLFAGSFTFIFLFMWLQTGSLFITGFGLLSIINGFLITDILYICVFGYEYLGIFHVLSLFIILGIGADDIFVFVDTWKESAFAKWPSLAHRMDHTYKHAMEAMLYTSLTTAIAFFVSGGSPFLAVSSFGIFSGTLIIVNYLSVVIHFPSVIAMYHIYFEKYKCCCCCERKPNGDGTEAQQGFIVRFLAGPYWKFVTHYIIKWVILGVFVAIIGTFIYFATTLKVNEEQVKFLPTDTNIGAVLEKAVGDFSTGDNPQRVFLVWGLKEQDLSKCGHSEYDCYGETVFNNNFNMNRQRVQEELLNFCKKIKNLSNSKIKELKIKRNIVTNEPEVNCFVEEIEEFLDEDESTVTYNPTLNATVARYTGGTDLVYPLDKENVTTIMDAVDYIYNTSLLPSGHSRWFEIGMSYWLYNGFLLDEGIGPQFSYYSPLLGESKEHYTITFDDVDGLLNYKYLYATKLRYAAITVNLTINPNTLGFPTGLPIRDAWEDFMEKEMKSMPNELKGGFQCTPPDYYGFDLWHNLYVQRSLAGSAVQGIMIGLLVAAPILIVATRNWIIGLLATLVIALITMCVVGFIPMVGWKLGVLESINLVLVVGLAVDYCVHLAEGYSRSKHEDRASRVQDALREVGISVLSGAVTTLGSSFFLLFAIIIFFFQFGIFMFATIGFSVIFSIMFFMSLLAAIGPQRETGSIMPCVEWIRKTFCKKCECAGSADINP